MTIEESVALVMCHARCALGMLPPEQQREAARRIAREFFTISDEEEKGRELARQSSLPIVRKEIVVRRHPKDER